MLVGQRGVLSLITYVLLIMSTDARQTGVPNRPDKPMVVGFTSRAVNLSWSDPEARSPPVTYYVINRRIGDSEEWHVSDSFITENNSTTVQIDDLAPFTAYSFQVIAINSYGNSSPSDPSFHIITLREVPTGKPTIIAAHNISSTKIRLDWRAPSNDSIHGEFQGYRITYRPRDKENVSAEEIILSDPKLESYTIQTLDTFTQYLVSLQVFNPEGLGPSTTVVVMTDEGVPSIPVNWTVAEVTSTTAQLLWRQPSRPNGIIQGYRLYFKHNNFTDVMTIRNPEPTMMYTLTNLAPMTRYKVWLMAFTWKNEGAATKSIDILTDVGPPDPPVISNLSCHSSSSLYVEWLEPPLEHNPVDTFVIIYHPRDKADTIKQIRVKNSGKNLHHAILPNMTPDVTYEVRIIGIVRSMKNLNKSYEGKPSRGHTISLTDECQVYAETRVNIISRLEDMNVAALVGIVCATFALVLSIMVFIVWRSCISESYYSIDDRSKNSSTFHQIWNTQEGIRGAVSVSMFPCHLTALHSEDSLAFVKEFKDLESKHADDPVTTVTLRSRKNTCIGGAKIHFVDGFYRAEQFIVSAIPEVTELNVFWKLVWDETISVIVIFTDSLGALGLPNIGQWDGVNQRNIGQLQMTKKKDSKWAPFTIRQIMIKNGNMGKSKYPDRCIHVCQYVLSAHYLRRENPVYFVQFLRQCSQLMDNTSLSPVLVCASRKFDFIGSFLVLETMNHLICNQSKVNIFGYLRYIRQQCPLVVKRFHEYIFIHHVVNELVTVGNSSVRVATLHQYQDCLQKMMTCCAATRSDNQFENQYKMLTEILLSENDISSSLKQCNVAKNRSLTFVPVEDSRVTLTPLDGMEGSDYINATWIAGFIHSKEFIITQHPLISTALDFWSMVWEYEVQMIVLLGDMTKQDVNIFWPSDHVFIKSEHLLIKLVEQFQDSALANRLYLTIQPSTEGDKRNLCFLHHVGFMCQYCPISSFCELLKLFEDLRMQFGQGPVVVVDRFGDTEAATFCALVNIAEQMKTEDSVDIYSQAKLINVSRPGVWQSFSDYVFLYKCVEGLIQMRKNSPAQNGTMKAPKFDFNYWLQDSRLCGPPSETFSTHINT